MITETGQTHDFVSSLRPILERGNHRELVDYVERHFAPGQLIAALGCDDQDVTKVALACLAAMGTMEHVPAIVRHLRSADRMTVNLAEHALWSIWFRAGDDRANSDLKCVVSLIHEGRTRDAISALDALSVRCPCLAEVYHQRAIAKFLLCDYRAAATDYRRTLRLNPHHFSAIAGLGNALAMRGRLRAALRVYGRAYRCHPFLDGLRESIQQVHKRLDQRRNGDFSSARMI